MWGEPRFAVFVLLREVGNRLRVIAITHPVIRIVCRSGGAGEDVGHLFGDGAAGVRRHAVRVRPIRPFERVAVILKRNEGVDRPRFVYW